MNRFARMTIAALFLSATTVAAHAATDPVLDKVLRQLDTSSVKFQSAEADLQWDNYEKIVKETTSQYGQTYFLRKGGTIEVGITLAQKQGAAPTKYIHFANGKGDMYDAVAKKVTGFNAGENRSRVESFLALGFGGSGKDIEKSYTVALQGMEPVDGVTTAKLDLVPKDAETAQTFSHITMWIDTSRDIPLKQVTYTPEGDTRTAFYRNVRYNTPVDTKKYASPKR
ncbi:outer membrane lipoprotein-sorting protein [Terriglobus roseus DSM 18391]|uniref:Outer membrane lipoprotein-sorting protein n=1 Tax=Terriglobus roseus (strain DSM 18391 / NRRL B-41598 / KBS 63) TaxID=926566 RepID=I3ZK62_TERRK|nr:outer membrane lipoprotein-sorting protein [Terriglobus roseus]AFL89630.1 outer membrane lipoprotein-sorting protein [Terriglobus roseus DSM 18391]